MPERNCNKHLEWALLLLLPTLELETKKKLNTFSHGFEWNFNTWVFFRQAGKTMRQLVLCTALAFVIYYGKVVEGQSGM